MEGSSMLRFMYFTIIDEKKNKQFHKESSRSLGIIRWFSFLSNR